MPVTKLQIVARGLTNRCPNCGEHTLFPPWSFRVNRRCSACGTGFARGQGFFLGPYVLNYTISGFVFGILPVILGHVGLIPWKAGIILAVFGCLAMPVILYRSTWSWWLMLYFFFLPNRLPANGGPIGTSEED